MAIEFKMDNEREMPSGTFRVALKRTGCGWNGKGVEDLGEFDGSWEAVSNGLTLKEPPNPESSVEIVMRLAKLVKEAPSPALSMAGQHEEVYACIGIESNRENVERMYMGDAECVKTALALMMGNPSVVDELGEGVEATLVGGVSFRGSTAGDRRTEGAGVELKAA